MPPTMTSEDVEILHREAVYGGHVRVDRFRLRHRLHDGGWSGPLQRELVERGHAVAVLPYDPGRDEVVLIRQFRIGALAAGRPPWLVEIVAGIIEDGEDALDVARRETLEETGLEVSDLIQAADCLVSPGFVSETVAIYCARADTAGGGGIYGLKGEGEDIEAFPLPWPEALAQLRSGAFGDAKTIIALQWLALNRDDLRSKWS